MRKRRQGPDGVDRVYIRPLVECWQKEALMAEAARRGKTMNALIREALEERYGRNSTRHRRAYDPR